MSGLRNNWIEVQNRMPTLGEVGLKVFRASTLDELESDMLTFFNDNPNSRLIDIKYNFSENSRHSSYTCFLCYIYE